MTAVPRNNNSNSLRFGMRLGSGNAAQHREEHQLSSARGRVVGVGYCFARLLLLLLCSEEVALVVTKMMTITLKSNGCGSNKMLFFVGLLHQKMATF